jgi:dolichyl-diphosphooligosaccharide--protein glycosyltransferase
MSNRTVLVDNNTWNNTHIATVGRAMASNEADAYPILRSLDVDYVLVVFGSVARYSSDDINKFLWMVRIAQGVYPDEVVESNFYSQQGRYDMGPEGNPKMHESIMFKMSYYRFTEMMTEYDKPTGYDPIRQTVIGGVCSCVSLYYGFCLSFFCSRYLLTH